MRLAVILPVYNATPYLAECLDSLLSQTFGDFCIIAVNDCSTDHSGELLEQYAQRDRRLRVYHFPDNRNEPAVARFAMDMTHYMNVDYVARMDSDDICLPERFARQVAFLDSHPDITVLGTRTQFFGAQSTGSSNAPLHDADIKANMILARGNISNPTSMWRLEWFKQHDIQYGSTVSACDYAMWVDCAIKQAKFANLADNLVKYRLHPGQLSCKTDDINASVQITLQRLMRVLFPVLSEQEASALTHICHGVGTITLPLKTVKLAFTVFERIKAEQQSVLGENRPRVLQLLAHRVNYWKKQIS